MSFQKDLMQSLFSLSLEVSVHYEDDYVSLIAQVKSAGIFFSMKL